MNGFRNLHLQTVLTGKMGRTFRRRRRKPRNLVTTPQVQQLYAWIQKLGFEPRSALRLALTPTSGRGLVCLHKISKGDVIIDLPQHVLITPGRVRAEYGLKGDNLSAEEVLTMFLLQEKSRSEFSKWKPYIDSLPDSFDALGSGRPVDGLPSALRLAVQRWNDAAWRSFLKLREHFSKKRQEVTFEAFLWAWCAANTRCIFVEGHGSTLAPFLDMLNHHWRASIETSFEENHFIIRSNDEYEAGEEVFISYGSHDNRTLLLNYGFVLDDNPNDCVTVELEHLVKLHSLRNVSNFDKKMDFLRKHGLFSGQTGYTSEGATWNLEIVLQVLKNESAETWKQILMGATTCDCSEWKKVLAFVMLEDFGETDDLMVKKLVQFEKKILYSVINGSANDGVT